MTLPSDFILRKDFLRYPRNRPKGITLEMKTVLQRGYCEWCGKTIDELIKLFKKLDVHHIDCNPCNNHITNLMALCEECHGMYHSYYPNWKYLSDHEIQDIIAKGKNILDGSHFSALVFKYGEDFELESHQYGKIILVAGCLECREKWEGNDCHIKARTHHLGTNHETWIHGEIKLVYAGSAKYYSKVNAEKRKNMYRENNIMGDDINGTKQATN